MRFVRLRVESLEPVLSWRQLLQKLSTLLRTFSGQYVPQSYDSHILFAGPGETDFDLEVRGQLPEILQGSPQASRPLNMLSVNDDQ